MMIPLAGTPTLIPTLVPAERRQTANALEVLGFTLGGVIGPAVGGLMIARWVAPAAVLINAAIYLYFDWALLRLAPQPPSAGKTRAPQGFGEAAKLIAGNAVLLSTTLMFLVFNIGLGLLLV